MINAVLFQLNWFACVLGAVHDQLWLPLLTLSAMLFQSARSASSRADLYLVAGVALVGFFLDSLWVALGILEFATDGPAPIWIVMMWMGVALTVNHSLQWLQGMPILGGVLAAVSAPACYLGGAQLGAVVVQIPGLWLISMAWLLVFCGIFYLARITGSSPQPA